VEQEERGPMEQRGRRWLGRLSHRRRYRSDVVLDWRSRGVWYRLEWRGGLHRTSFAGGHMRAAVPVRPLISHRTLGHVRVTMDGQLADVQGDGEHQEAGDRYAPQLQEQNSLAHRK